MVYIYQDSYTQNMSTLGKNIKHFRNRFDLKQEELALILNFGLGQLKHWETGRNEPDVESLKKLASFFRVSVDELIGFTNEKTDDPLEKVYIEIKKSYLDLDDYQKSKFEKQVIAFAKMLRSNKEML